MRMRVPAGELFNDLFRTLGSGAGHRQQHRHLRGAQIGQGRRAGESAGARRFLQAVRSRQVRQHDQPHVVGLQPDGAPRHVAAPPADIQVDRAQRRPGRAAAAPGSGSRKRTAARGADQAGTGFNDVDQAPFRRALSGFYNVEGKDRGPARGRCSKRAPAAPSRRRLRPHPVDGVSSRKLQEDGS